MRKSKSCNRKSKGFTLLELVLAMAIMLIVIPFVFGTFYIINVSHANVTLINDAKDFAALNGRAIENILINAKAVTVSSSSSPEAGYSVLSFNTDGTMLLNGTPPFTYDHYKVKDGTQKWTLAVTFVLDPGTKTINYTIQVKDNSKVGKPVKYTLNSSVYLPSAQVDLLLGTSGTVVKFYEPTF
jgi:prepilin-type N-terminal cleavage/methylation domain-containing protein